MRAAHHGADLGIGLAGAAIAARRLAPWYREPRRRTADIAFRRGGSLASARESGAHLPLEQARRAAVAPGWPSEMAMAARRDPGLDRSRSAGSPAVGSDTREMVRR